jgi:hypothetical protein
VKAVAYAQLDNLSTNLRPISLLRLASPQVVCCAPPVCPCPASPNLKLPPQLSLSSSSCSLPSTGPSPFTSLGASLPNSSQASPDILPLCFLMFPSWPNVAEFRILCVHLLAFELLKSQFEFVRLSVLTQHFGWLFAINELLLSTFST